MNGRELIAVTGMGLITSLGNTLEETWQGMMHGRSGVKTISRFSPKELPTQFAACVDTFDSPLAMPFERVLHLARSAMREALSHAHLAPGDMDKTRLFLATSTAELDWTARLAQRRPELLDESDNAEEIRARLVDVTDQAYAGNILSHELGLKLPPISVTTACASGASAIQLAQESLLAGHVQKAIVVAADSSVFPEGILRFALLSALSKRNDNPAGACRPFSKDRDGFVMGEAGAALTLERYSDAQERGAPIYGFILGCGDATDNFHRTRSHPSGDAILASMQNALDRAHLSPDQIDYVNAHGTGTPENDKMEALGVMRLFASSPRTPPISANKSMIGHTLTAAGAVEAVITLKTLSAGVLPPTINCHAPDPEITLDVVPNVARPCEGKYALSNSFGFGGQNVTLVLARADAFSEENRS